MKNILRFAFILSLLAATLPCAKAATPSPSPWGDLSDMEDATKSGTQSHANPGDGIFIPTTSSINADKTGRPFTVPSAMSEPGFADIVAAGKPTGDSYIVKFPASQAGGACMFDGNSRYFIESNGMLAFQISSQCGNLKRGYNFRICTLNEQLRCAEAPWYYFTGRTYAVTAQGVVVNNATLYAWDNQAQAPQNLQKIAATLQKINGAAAGKNAQPSRVIDCRNYQPEKKKYALSESKTTCMVKFLCNADKMPNITAIRDGDAIDWNSPLGSYIKQDKKITDVTNWVCWLRTE